MPSPASYSFTVYQGQTWEETLIVNNPDGSPTDLTGFKARMQVREELSSADVVLELDEDSDRLVISDPVNGTITLLVDAADMADLPLAFEPQSWVYDLEIYRETPAPEYVQRILQGSVIAYPEVTR